MIVAKKSLGQHFLASSAYVRAMADAGDIETDDVVLEVGPGKGVLTRELLNRGANVVAVEKDHRLIPHLEAQFAKEVAARKLRIIEADILEFDPASLKAKGWKLIANIPYYITGALFEKFLGREPRPHTLVFLVQKEVGERIAKAKKESLLSLSIKAYGEPRYIKTVPRGAFAPAPSVDSAIVAVRNISAAHFMGAAHEEAFFAVLHAGFAHKRKLLVRNLEPLFGREGARQALADASPPQARAEDVALAQWLTLAKQLLSIKATSQRSA